MNKREAIFISHANPEDNAFTVWLGAKLSAVGYEVWADVLRLRGGHDWQRLLENALRERACKVLLVANEYSVRKQGVRNEIQIASDVARKINDSQFIIPLRMGSFDAPFLVAHAQYIDFERSWASGLAELFELLQEIKVPKHVGNTNAWLDVQLLHGKALTQGPERLLSSWLQVRRVPTYVYFSRDSTEQSDGHGYPSTVLGEGVLTFNKGPASGKYSRRRTNDFLQKGWPALGIERDDARRRFADLANQAVARILEAKGLNRYEMANRQVAWWISATGPQTRVSFKWPDYVGSRQVQGTSVKRNIRWHFGISTSFRSVPFHHIRLKSRLVFTEDGFSPIPNTGRAHRLRRSFAKGWRNARWRDMLLAFLFWVTEGTTILDVPVSDDESFVLSVPPVSFSCPVGIPDADDSPQSDDDDPEIEFLNDEELEDDSAKES